MTSHSNSYAREHLSQRTHPSLLGGVAGPNPRRAAPGFAPTAAIGGSPPNGALGLPRSPSRRVTFKAADDHPQARPRAHPGI